MTRRVVKAVGAVLGGAALLVACFAVYVQLTGIPRYASPTLTLKVDATPERVERGRRYVSMLCATCHLDPTTRRLTGKRMEDTPVQFGIVVSKNITRHPAKGIGAWTDGELAWLLRTGIGRDGRFVPPYMVRFPHLADEDLFSIIAFLRSDDPLVAGAEVDPPGVTRPSFLTKLLSHIAWRPLPYPSGSVVAPPTDDRVARGRYLVSALECYPCHSASFKTVDVSQPEKTPGFMGGGNELNDLHGGRIKTSNLTPDASGIGHFTEADFVRALKKGFRPDGKIIRYPMVPMPELTDEEAASIFAYLRVLPPIPNTIARVDDAIVDADRGKRTYFKYACVSCHGNTGIGIADLRGSAERYPTDAELIAWIRNPAAFRPGTKMPAWDGVIAEEDYGPLVAYVRKLGAVPAAAR